MDHVRTPQSYCGHPARSCEARYPNATQRDRRRIRPAPRQTARHRVSCPAIPAPSSAVPCGKAKKQGIRVQADAPIRLDSLASIFVGIMTKDQLNAPKSAPRGMGISAHASGFDSVAINQTPAPVPPVAVRQHLPPHPLAISGTCGTRLWTLESRTRRRSPRSGTRR